MKKSTVKTVGIVAITALLCVTCGDNGLSDEGQAATDAASFIEKFFDPGQQSDPCANGATPACCASNPYYPGCSGTPPTTYTLTVNSNPTAGGSVSPTSQSNITAGTSVYITAAAASGYTFSYWTISGSGTLTNAYSEYTYVTLNGNVTVTAHFTQNVTNPTTYTLTVNRNPTAGGSVSPTAQSNITAGTSVYITAAAASGYTFSNWAISGSGTLTNAYSDYTYVTVNGNVTVTAYFTQNVTNPTIGTFQDSRDNKTYKMVTIGNQTWMAENLNYQTSSSKCYDDDNSNCNTYGRLYKWNDASTACPSGWHLPTDAEWTTLVNYAGGENTAGKKLKSKSGWDDNGNGTDEYGFSALPGGRGFSDGSFGGAGYYGYWWSATELVASYAWFWCMVNYGGDVLRSYDIKAGDLLAVRCVQD